MKAEGRAKTQVTAKAEALAEAHVGIPKPRLFTYSPVASSYLVLSHKVVFVRSNALAVCTVSLDMTRQDCCPLSQSSLTVPSCLYNICDINYPAEECIWPL